MTCGHSYSNIATKTMAAQRCPGLVAKARDKWAMGQSHWSNNDSGYGFNEEASILKKGLGSNNPRVK
jgi:hypothetical protein